MPDPYSPASILAAQVTSGKIVLAEMPMVQQSPIDEQIREYILQQERNDQARHPQERIDEPVRQERGKWQRRLGYFTLAGIAVVVFALSEYFPDKPSQVVLMVLEGGALAFLSALIYINGFLWVTEKLGYKAEPRSFKLTLTSTGIVFFGLWAAWAYAVFSRPY